MTRYRTFEQGKGWSQWQEGPQAGDWSDTVCLAYVRRERPDIENPRTDDGMSLSTQRPDGDSGDRGIAMVTHDKGVICVEYGP